MSDKKQIDARVEWLGKLNDRRLAANEAGDVIELEAVAREYELLKRPCLKMAEEIRLAVAVRLDTRRAIGYIQGQAV